jgi:hypothetical protein
LFVVGGNHDGAEANISSDTVFYNNCYGKISDKYNIVRDGVHNYYYVDYPLVKTRLVFLSMPDNGYWGIGTEQLIWLKDKALNVEEGFGVILFSHMPPMIATTSTNAGLYNYHALAEILTAFQNHTSGETGLYTEPYNINFDFTRYINTKVIAMLCGHVHADRVMSAGENLSGIQENLLPCPCITIGAGAFVEGVPHIGEQEIISGATTPSRTLGTETECLFDIVGYYPNENKLKLTRFGAGVDRIIDVN